MPTSPEQIFDVLADGWRYPAWVVGASHVRAVDEDWADNGSRIHHSVGLWPAVVRDQTVVVDSHRPDRLTMEVAVWFLGRGTVQLTLTAQGEGHTEVVMTEEMRHGVMAKLPDVVVDPLLSARNKESLARLEALALRRTQP